MSQLLIEMKKKGQIITNVVIEPSTTNGLLKKSVADYLQSRPIDHIERLVKILGRLENKQIEEVDYALKIVFGLE